MKTLQALGLILMVSLPASITLADPCILSDDLIELNGVSTSGENCIVNVKYSFTLTKNNGNKFAYIHFWLTSNYSAPDYKKGPTKDELGNVLATIALSTDSPVTLLPDYDPDNTVTPLFAGLTVSETDLGGGNFRITVDNIQLVVPVPAPNCRISRPMCGLLSPMTKKHLPCIAFSKAAMWCCL